MSDCIFCAVASREVPAEIVAEEEDVIAFRDVNPQAPVHVLVVPRQHIESVAAMGESHDSLWANLRRVALGVANREGIAATGFRIVVNTGRDGGQTVSHLHVHVLGGRPMSWPPG